MLILKSLFQNKGSLLQKRHLRKPDPFSGHVAGVVRSIVGTLLQWLLAAHSFERIF